MRIMVEHVGGTHVKVIASGQSDRRELTKRLRTNSESVDLRDDEIWYLHPARISGPIYSGIANASAQVRKRPPR
jgi:hypothetical protein